jgi:hypothetical protein
MCYSSRLLPELSLMVLSLQYRSMEGISRRQRRITRKRRSRSPSKSSRMRRVKIPRRLELAGLVPNTMTTSMT